MTLSRGEPVVVSLDEPTKVGDARRRATGLARELGFDDTRQATTALIVTEAATNIIKHAGGGQIVVLGRKHEQFGERLEVLALDSGRGISDLGRCFADGYSTAGSPGTGLGAIRRLADEFEIYSGEGMGTVLWAGLDRSPPPRVRSFPRTELGVVSLPAPGEQVCGDAWAAKECDGRTLIMMVDGLGHGPIAALAAEEAVRVFLAHGQQEPEPILESAHAALRSTRGAAMAIARLDHDRCELRYAGVGNISGVILSAGTGETVSMVSHNGTLGYAIRKIQTYDYAWPPDSLLIMHSDGLAGRWNLDRYPGLRGRHPSLVTGMLYRDHTRGRDDVTVLAARQWSAGRS